MAETVSAPTLIRPLPSSNNVINFRDVGGMPCRGGGTTRHRVLLRSGTLRLLTDGDAEALVTGFGVSTVVDLRTARELAADVPSAFARAGLMTVHLPLMREDRFALPEAEDVEDAMSALHRAYHAYLDLRGHHVATAARLLASSTGATLVHCAAGKDRTGVAVAVLLEAVGVQRSAVLADYLATNDAIEHIMSTLGTMYGYRPEVEGVDVTAHLARPAALTAVLERLDEEHGGAAGWLRTQGVSDGDLTALHDRLVRTSESDMTR